MKKLMNGFVMALLGGAASLGLYKAFEPEIVFPENQKQEETRMVNLLSSEPNAGVDYVTAAEATVNGVVHVKTAGTVEYRQRSFDPFRQFFYGDGSYEQKYIQPVKGAGSGVIVSKNGYVVTNNHVIENADEIDVTLNNKRTYKANLVGRDPATDLAVLKIEEEELPHLDYGNSDQLRIGEWVLAVGNPFNLTSTVTAGIVSAKGRDINILNDDPYTNMSSIESFIQTDAAVNPGNSGGALVNTKGELIGINAAIKSNTGSFAGYSFAIPSNIVKKVVNDLIEYGSVQRAYIGINIRNISEEIANETELDDLNGVYIAGFSENSSADDAGLKEGDIVKEVEGLEVHNVSELQAKIGEYQPGDEVAVTVLRNGELLTKSVTLKNFEGNTEIIRNESNEMMKTLGARLEDADEETLEKLAVTGGVEVKELLPGKLRKSGMQEGFIITGVDNKKVKNKNELFKILKDKKGGVLLNGVYPNGREAYYGFGM
ncbi:MAG: Do family serine endopeptidase [Vicingaceae bacterium]